MEEEEEEAEEEDEEEEEEIKEELEHLEGAERIAETSAGAGSATLGRMALTYQIHESARSIKVSVHFVTSISSETNCCQESTYVRLKFFHTSDISSLLQALQHS